MDLQLQLFVRSRIARTEDQSCQLWHESKVVGRSVIRHCDFNRLFGTTFAFSNCISAFILKRRTEINSKPSGSQ